MKELLLDTRGHSIKQVKKTASAAKSGKAEKQSFQSFIAAQGKDEKLNSSADSDNSNNQDVSVNKHQNDTEKGENVKENEKQDNHENARAAKGNKNKNDESKTQPVNENKEKSDKENKQSDKKTAPFVPFSSEIDLKTIISKIAGKNPEKTTDKASQNIAKEGQLNRQPQTGNTDKSMLKKNAGNTGKRNGKGKVGKTKDSQVVSNKEKQSKSKSSSKTDVASKHTKGITNNSKAQTAAGSKSGKTKSTQTAAGLKGTSKGEMVLLGTGAKSKSTSGKATGKESPLFKKAVSTAYENQGKQAAQNMNPNQSQKQVPGKLNLTQSVKTVNTAPAFKKHKTTAKDHSAKSTSSKGQTNSTSGKQTAGSQANNVTSKAVNSAISKQQQKLLNTGSLTWKEHSDQSSHKDVKLKMEADKKGDLKGKTKQSSTGSNTNGLKTVNFAEPAGRKAFSRQLARQVGRPQFRRQASSTKQTTAWDHHRLRLNDGKSIHIASRTSNGALQLQLNVGNGQLGKILQQHLQEIQQHLQQQLNIDINLQLQDFGQQQEQSEQSTLKQSKDEPEIKDNAPVAESDNTVQAQPVRYFGFNQNEWTA